MRSRLCACFFSMILGVSITVQAKIPQDVVVVFIGLHTHLKDLIALDMPRRERSPIAGKFKLKIYGERKVLQDLFDSGTISRGEMFQYRMKLASLYIKINDWEKGKI